MFEKIKRFVSDPLGRKRSYIGRTRYINQFGVVSVFLFGLISVYSIFPITNKMDEADAIYTPSTTTLSIDASSNVATVDITPVSGDGTFAASTSDIAFGVTTNNVTGYTVSLLGNDATGNLTNAEMGTTLDPLTVAADTNTFTTGAAATYSNKWGIKPNKYNSATNTNYRPAPTTSASTTIEVTSAANTSSIDYTIGVGARMDYSKPAGTYTSTFTLVAVGNPISYQINYLDSDGTTPLLPQESEGDVTVSSFTLNSTEPTKADYVFLGWCDGTLGNGGATCSGTVYQPGDNYTFSNLSTATMNVANLYAMWAVPMQNLSERLCTTATPTYVADVRDKKVYTVQRLADDECWMTSNFNLTGGTALYSETSNVPDGYPEAGGVAYFTLPDSSTSGFDVDTAASVYNSGNETTFQSDCNASSPCNSYYSWVAAAAGGKDENGNIITSSGESAPYSICPKGWKLPKSGDTSNYKQGELYKFATAYGANLENSSGQSSPVLYNNVGPGTTANLLLSGSYFNNSFSSYFTTISYWSATKTNTNYSKSIDITSSSFNIAQSHNSRAGYAIRCVRDSALTMQSFSFSDANAMSVGDSVTLKDIRDDKDYTVTKLADGNVWMTTNLLFTGTQLSPDTSNVSSNITIRKDDSSEGYGALTSGNSYTEPRLQVGVDDNGDPTVWYNYAAASADTNDGSSNITPVVQDICPRGWRLPTYTEQAGLVALIGSTAVADGFNPVAGGYYGYTAGQLTSQGYGFWWSSTDLNTTERNVLGYNSSILDATAGVRYRYLGFYIRCIKDTEIEIQNISQDVLSDLIPGVGDNIVLTDNRDGQKYRVARLADGNIWMVDNLNIGAIAITEDLTESNTNFSNNRTVAAATFNGWKKTSVAGNNANPEYIETPNVDTTSQIQYGSLYNFCAVSAGQICSSNSAVITDDICPAGWRLPTGGNDGEYKKLYSQANYNTYTKLHASVLNGGPALAFSGRINAGSGSSPQSRGTADYTWTSTPYSGTARYNFFNDVNSVQPTQSSSTFYSMSVRCILKDSRTINSATYMQDVNPQMVANTSEGTTKTLRDIRDNKQYTVAKINGGLWMTQNLAFIGKTGDPSGTMTLDSTTSNIATSQAITYTDLDGGTNDYTNAMIHNSGNTTNGVWYNYAAASAKTITGSSNTSAQTQDVCPAGWRLPNQTEQSAIISYATDYNPVVGGVYNGGSLTLPGEGHWWGSTSLNATGRYGIYYDGTNLMPTTNYLLRNYGRYVRCIAK